MYQRFQKNLLDACLMSRSYDDRVPTTDKEGEWDRKLQSLYFFENLNATGIWQINFADHTLDVIPLFELLQKRRAGGECLDMEAVQIQQGAETVSNRRVAIHNAD